WSRIVAERVALVGRAPQVSGRGVDADACRIADTRGIHLHELSVGGVLEDVRAVELGFVLVGIVDVRQRTDGDPQAFAVGREGDVARRMAAGRQIGNDGRRRVIRLHVAALVRKAHDRIRVADVEPQRIRPGGNERDAVRLPQPAGVHRHLFRLAIGGASAEYLDLYGERFA